MTTGRPATTEPLGGWTAGPRALGIGVLVGIALLVGSVACSPTPEGTRRASVKHWPAAGGGAAPVVRYRGEEVYQDGRWRQDGEATFFDRTGQETARGTYRLGLEHGPWEIRREDGTRGRGQFRDGKRQGTWVYFDDQGRRQEEGSYLEGERDGRWTSWYSNGEIESEVHWRRGKRHGAAVYRNRDGTLNTAESGTYSEGVKVGG